MPNQYHTVEEYSADETRPFTGHSRRTTVYLSRGATMVDVEGHEIRFARARLNNETLKPTSAHNVLHAAHANGWTLKNTRRIGVTYHAHLVSPDKAASLFVHWQDTEGRAMRAAWWASMSARERLDKAQAKREARALGL